MTHGKPGRLIWAVAIIISMALPAQAHTVAELETWTEAWVIEADVALSPGLTKTLENMVDLHPWYYNPQPEPATRRNWNAGVEQWRTLVAVYFPANEVDRALCIMDHESRGNPNADNPKSSAAGLFQFLTKTWNGVPLSVSGGSYESGQVYQAEPNIRSAAWLQARGSGWNQWSPYNAGECR